MDDLQNIKYILTSGDLEEGASKLRSLIKKNPKHLDARNLYAQVLFTQKNHTEAIQQLKKIVKVNPRAFSAWLNLGHCYGVSGKTAFAISAYQKSTQLDPKNAQSLLQLIRMQKKARKNTEVIKTCKEGLKHLPENISIWVLMAETYLDLKKFEECKQALEKAKKIDENYEGVLLLQARFYAHLGMTKKTKEYLLKCRETKKLPVELFLYDDALTGDELLEYMKSVGSYYTELAGTVHEKYWHSKDPEKTLRVGIYTPRFYSHVIAHFLNPVFEESSNIEYFYYSDSPKSDLVTSKFRNRAKRRWRDITRLSTADACAKIKQDEIDILIDLEGPWGSDRMALFAYRPAPVQVSWLGYPVTSGMDSMDWRLACPIADPVELTGGIYTEKLMHVSCGAHCYTPLSELPSLQAAPYHKNGLITFGSFNNLFKINDFTLDLWADLLLSVKDSRLVLKHLFLDNEMAQNRIEDMMSRKGVSMDRIDFLPSSVGRNEHIAEYARLDIALDPYPYSGTTTTMDAISMGVPVIAMLDGELPQSRVSGGLLHHIGHSELVADSRTSYLEIAQSLAEDRQRIDELHHSLRDAWLNSPVGDPAAYALELEKSLRKIWHLELKNINI